MHAQVWSVPSSTRARSLDQPIQYSAPTTFKREYFNSGPAPMRIQSTGILFQELQQASSKFIPVLSATEEALAETSIESGDTSALQLSATEDLGLNKLKRKFRDEQPECPPVKRLVKQALC